MSVSVYLKISPDTGAHLAKTIRNKRERDETSTDNTLDNGASN